MKQYLDLLHKVREHGKFKTDRTGTGTFSIIGEQMRFNLAYGFPLLTTKKVHLKSIIHELLWFLSGKTDVQYLQDNGVTIWDAWSNAETCAKYGRVEGDLGPIYGHQWRNFGATLDENGDYLPNGIDQISRAIDTIKNNPDSRRIIVTGWNPTEVDSVSLPPCHTLFQFFCEPLAGYEMLDYGTPEERLEYDEFSDSTPERYKRIKTRAKEKGHPTHRLSCQLYCRSQDLFLGTPFNIASYALLLMMVAQVTNTVAHELIWVGGDCHVYKNHTDQVDEILTREPRQLPTMTLNPLVNDIFDFKYEDFMLIGYDPHPAIKAPVAV